MDLGLGAGWFYESQAYGIPFPPVGDRVPALADAAGHQGRSGPSQPHRRRPVLHLWTAPPAHPPTAILRVVIGRGSWATVQRIAATPRARTCAGTAAAKSPNAADFSPGVGGGHVTRCDRRSRCCWHPPSPARKIREEFAPSLLAHRRTPGQVCQAPEYRPRYGHFSRFHTP